MKKEKERKDEKEGRKEGRKEGKKEGRKEGRKEGGRVYKGVQRTKKELTATVLLDLTRLCVWQHYYYNIYLIETKGQQSGRLLPTHSTL